MMILYWCLNQIKERSQRYLTLLALKKSAREIERDCEYLIILRLDEIDVAFNGNSQSFSQLISLYCNNVDCSFWEVISFYYYCLFNIVIYLFSSQMSFLNLVWSVYHWLKRVSFCYKPDISMNHWNNSYEGKRELF